MATMAVNAPIIMPASSPELKDFCFVCSDEDDFRSGCVVVEGANEEGRIKVGSVVTKEVVVFSTIADEGLLDKLLVLRNCSQKREPRRSHKCFL